MKRIFYALSLSLLFPMLTSCGKEEVKPVAPLPIVQPSEVQGEWSGVSAMLYIHDAAGHLSDTKLEHITNTSFTFTGSNGYREKFASASMNKETGGTYSLSGEVLNISPDNVIGVRSGAFQVDTLNAHRFVFRTKTGYTNSLGGLTTITYTAKR